jgi:drug/metabolite transporter (DMT)-like permease
MTTGRWKLGFSLALLTAVLWGVLPIALKLLLETMDAYTVTWYRFVAAAALLGAFLGYRQKLPSISQLKQANILVLAVAIFGLSGNYILYMVGLDHISPETAQMVIQLAPMFLLLGGLIHFKETFRRIQWVGLIVLVGGLLLYFNDRLADLANSNGTYYFGVLIIMVAAFLWASYALAQKQLLLAFRSDQVLLIIYFAAAIIIYPAVTVSQLGELSQLQWFLLIFSCLNTLVAYGCFAEALAHWEASRVSAVLAITPLITLVSIWLFARKFPDIMVSEQLNHLSIIGASLVVVGSMLTALGRRRERDGAPVTPPLMG